ncbi:hypothetical protein AMELA_G00266680 [Ameiurus melas]|uniref:Uncharacterized protein n=1 Tax=Ameiurus melas TaxID=219545 RepID=A0A7J5ZPR2_AMEME|nr:hypothetical protein AMELA_G00266680 [Ameiurus melas]
MTAADQILRRSSPRPTFYTETHVLPPDPRSTPRPRSFPGGVLARARIRGGQGQIRGLREEKERRAEGRTARPPSSPLLAAEKGREMWARGCHTVCGEPAQIRKQTPGLRPRLPRLDPERVAERIRAETRRKSGGIMVFLCSSSSPVLQRCLTAADPIKARARIDLQPLLTSMQMSRTRPIRGERSRPGRSARVAAALKRTPGFDSPEARRPNDHSFSDGSEWDSCLQRWKEICNQMHKL